MKASGDLSLVAYYYLLRIGEYTRGGSRSGKKQTVDYRMRDVLFFIIDEYGGLKQLPRNASDENIMAA
jgi:hypothetical protein